MTESRAEQTFETLAGETDGDDGQREARNGLRHMASLSLTKVSDGLIDPKLVLSWLLTGLGAPAAFVGALVPIREAGALLPQMGLAVVLRRMTQRKWMWVAGSAVQGLAAAGIAVAVSILSGWLAGLVVCLLLAVLAVARAACSVSYKDILGKTVGNTRRGAVTGFAGSVSAAVVFGYALLLLSGLMDSRWPVIAAVALAAVLWVVAAAILAALSEPASEEAAPEKRPAYLAILRRDAQLRRFITVRGLLVVTSLAPPYFVVIAGQSGAQGLERLGALVLASSAAAFVSSYLWGRLADRSSRRVLMLSGFVAALAMLGAVALTRAGLADGWAIAGALFLQMIAYHGVRQGRSTYLVDMAPEEERASYAALANTVIGTLLLVVGALGGALSALGADWALLGFAGLSVLGAFAALGLNEVERAG
ncbi:MFS transporter [Lutimaribacter sp. EGI FJ00015]|uniref:MFS transporter n=1 Tax=Lutimaribacter degradans TaxID=2945989 RepID=A0ACC5ZR16_9RHOB|nr:MFS transporter [Lutimaribacter sp. EGI FJ00013]MCM2560562.1 MFS transporter [Lutimaribacter sp. EGI FJ00013]MCO0612495.1 MFS transporter [Lutimaribacter sp. EGI FJ00015]MCO0634386.1 MFS transporter [Lutimaribacter sp. EGI FJ00014]